MSLVRGRRGATPADVTVFMATIALALALLYPSWSARGFRGRVEAVFADVDTAIAAARRSREATGSWPTPSATGEAPPELPGVAFARPEYRLAWTTWSVVDSVQVVVPPVVNLGDGISDATQPEMQPIVRVVGALAVHSADAALLAELSQRYAEQTSFALDSMWMLLLPERGVAR